MDVGSSKFIKREQKTWSLIGTPYYIAPEIIQGKGYSFEIDVWSMGVCMFEFMCGYYPFGNNEDDPVKIY